MKIYLFIFVLLIYCSRVFAGWKIIREVRDEAGNVYETIMYFQNRNLLVKEGTMFTVVNQNTGRMILFNTETGKYWTGNKEDFKKEMEIHIEKTMIEAMGKKAYEKFRESVKIGDDTVAEMPDEPDIRIEKTDTIEQLAGYRGIRYKVFVAGEMVEELWLCPEINAFDELNLYKMDDFFGSNDKEFDYATSDAYINMLKKNGFPIKEIHYSFGERTEEIRLKSAEKKNLSNDLFNVPVDGQKVGLSEMISSGY